MKFIAIYLLFFAYIFATPVARGAESKSCEALFTRGKSLPQLLKGVERPYRSPEPIGRAEPFVVPEELASLLPDGARVTAREYNAEDMVDQKYFSILLNGQPILTVDYRPNGYREIDIFGIEVAKPVRELGLEKAAVTELLRRYPSIDRVGFLLKFHALEPIDSPLTTTLPAMREFATSLGLTQLKVVTRKTGTPRLVGTPEGKREI